MTERTTATFKYIDVLSDVHFRCTLDKRTLQPCPFSGLTYHRLRLGTHRFRVAAQQGSVLSSATSWTWTIVAATGPRRGDHTGDSVPARPLSRGATTMSTVQISGAVDGTLRPGLALPVDVTFSNPYAFDIRVQSLSIAVSQQTWRHGEPNPDCSGPENLSVEHSLLETVVIAAHRTRSLSELGVAQSDWPAIQMPDLPSNQDACKTTAFSFAFHAVATKA
jgi:hypothetical protein